MARQRSGWLLVVACLSCGNIATAAASTRVRICFAEDVTALTYLRDGEIRGLHGALIDHALRRLDFGVDWVPMPWSRCLLEAQAGRIDAIATASYTAERAQFLRFPEDADARVDSRWAVAHTRDVVVTAAASQFQFDGQLSGLPTPVRAPRGWAVTAYLRERGVMVDAGAPNDESNLLKLLRDQTGCVIAIEESVYLLQQQLPMARTLRVDPRPLRTKSYFLPFSRRSPLPGDTVQAIWDTIETLRNDTTVMEQIRRQQR